MDYRTLVDFYKNNYELKVYATKLFSPSSNCYLMYVYNYKEEISNFVSTFCVYLPFYIRNSDQLSSIESENIEQQLISRSKKMRFNSTIIPQRNLKMDGLYGELFLDFYLRIVCERKLLLSYALKREYKSNNESHGFDNVVFSIDNNSISVYFCEAKFVSTVNNAKRSLCDDINGHSNSMGHLTKEFINSYFQFIVEKGINLSDKESLMFKNFIGKLNSQLDNGIDFVDFLINEGVKFVFVFFAIFESNYKKVDLLKNYYDDIYNEAINKIKILNIKNYDIEIVFIPTDNPSKDIKQEIDNEFCR